jgi:CLIP-associating protein 1/2
LQLKEINSRLDKIEPNAPSSDGARMQCKAKKSVSAPKRGGPKKKSMPREHTYLEASFTFSFLDHFIQFV